MKKVLSIFLIFSLLMPLSSGYAQTNHEASVNIQPFSDTNGHWAEETIRKHYEMGMIEGYKDGSFKPNNAMKRSELITVINKYFGLKDKDSNNFDDVPEKAWYADEAAKAKSYRYIEELNARPTELAKREDVVKMMSLILDVDEQNLTQDKIKFTDLQNVDDNMNNSIEKFSENGWMSGYGNGEFKPDVAIRRAEILTIFDNVLGYIVADQEDFDNVPVGAKKITIINPDILIKNRTIKGDLYISPGVNGRLIIKDTHVEGQIQVSGGTKDKPIQIENTEVGEIVITKAKGIPHIKIIGESKVGEIKTKTETMIVASGKTTVELVNTDAKTSIEMLEGTKIDKLIINEETLVDMDDGSSISKLESNNKTEIKGQGKIESARIDYEEVTIETKPNYIEDNNKEEQEDKKSHSSSSKKDRTAPSGYGVKIDQTSINNANKTDFTFAFSGAEVGATYNYSIDDTNDATSAVIGSGKISTATDGIGMIDVSDLDDGNLTLSVYLIDVHSNKGGNITDNVIKDVVAPKGYSVKIDQIQINNGNKSALSFTFAGANIGTSYNYSLDDTNGSTTAIVGNGIISTSTDQISGIDISALNDGILTLTVSLTDAAENKGLNSSATVTKDTIAPIGYSVSIDQSEVNNSNKADLSFAFGEAEIDATYYYSIDDMANAETDTVTGSGTIDSESYQVTGIDISGLDDGTLTLTVYLRDTSLNQGVNVTATVIKDVVSPIGYSVNIDQAEIIGSNKTALSFTFANAEAGATYNYSIDDASNLDTPAITGEGVINSTTHQITEIDVSSMDDGTLTLTVSLTDTAENQGPGSTATITKNAEAPIGYSVSIDQSYINNSDKTAISFTFGGAETDATYYYSIDDVANAETDAVTGSGKIDSASHQVTGINVSGLDDDMLELTVYLTDTSFNQGINVMSTVQKDVVSPIGYSVNIDQAKIIGSNETALSFTFANAEAGATCNYSIDDASNPGTPAITGEGVINSTTHQITGIDVSSMDDDTLTLTVSLTDAAGNQGLDSSASVTKDATAPIGYSVGIDQSNINNSNKGALSFTFANAELNTTYNYSINDTDDNTDAITGQGTIISATQQISNVNVASLVDDILTLTVYLTDSNTNQGYNISDTVEKDIIGPTEYSFSIDQSQINYINEKALTFSFTNAEIGTIYNYIIDDNNVGTVAVTGTGIINTTTYQTNNIDVSELDNDTLAVTVYTEDESGNQGVEVNEIVEKDSYAPSISNYGIIYYKDYFPDFLILSVLVQNLSLGAETHITIDDENPETPAAIGPFPSYFRQGVDREVFISNAIIDLLDSGIITITVYQEDSAGNKGVEVTASVELDKEAPLD